MVFSLILVCRKKMNIIISISLVFLYHWGMRPLVVFYNFLSNSQNSSTLAWLFCDYWSWTVSIYLENTKFFLTLPLSTFCHILFSSIVIWMSVTCGSYIIPSCCSNCNFANSYQLIVYKIYTWPPFNYKFNSHGNWEIKKISLPLPPK